GDHGGTLSSLSDGTGLMLLLSDFPPREVGTLERCPPLGHGLTFRAMPDLPRTRKAVHRSGHAPLGVKAELRRNLIAALRTGRSGEDLFPGLVGYGETVIPQVVNAILAGHDLLLLGLRGQAKTRLARALTAFLDERVPALAGDPLRSHPL